MLLHTSILKSKLYIANKHFSCIYLRLATLQNKTQENTSCYVNCYLWSNSNHYFLMEHVLWSYKLLLQQRQPAEGILKYTQTKTIDSFCVCGNDPQGWRKIFENAKNPPL